MNKNLKIDVDNIEDSEVLESVLEHMLIKFNMIFGEKIVNKEECIVYIDSKSECPMFITNGESYYIRLAIEKTNYWCQVIYQLSHEIMHLIFRNYKEEKIIKWFEETMCESMSIYILKYFRETWSDCKLAKKNEKFDKAIERYLNDILMRESKNNFSEISSMCELENAEEKAEEERERRIIERNSIYDLFCKSKSEEIKNIIYYRNYIDGVMINFHDWKKTVQGNFEQKKLDFVIELEKIQPKILEK